MNSTISQVVSDPTHIAAARRSAAELAEQARFNDERAGTLALIVSEIASNIMKHANGGQVLLRQLYSEDLNSTIGVEVLGIDSGPGIMDLNRAMLDGYSSSGTMGGGLGAIRRASTLVDIFSQRGKGTVVLSHLLAPVSMTSGGAKPRSRPLVGGLSVALGGETICGDGWASTSSDGLVSIVVVDGLGHGVRAGEAASKAIATWRKDPFRRPEDILAQIDLALRSTRGAAAAVCQVNQLNPQVSYCGVGNIGGILINSDSVQHAVSMNGIIGQYSRTMRSFTYPWTVGSTLFMHSDGIASRWKASDYPGLFSRHPSLIAAVLFRDLCRGNDDATAVILRES